MEKTNIQNGFPSDMVPMRKKNQREWSLQYSNEFNKTGVRVVDPKTYAHQKDVAEGKGVNDNLKKQMGSRKRAGKVDMAWRNLDYSKLPIIPKFVKILKNKVLSNPKEFKIRAIDPWSVNQEQKRKNQIIAYLANQDLSEQAQKLGANVPSPFEQGEAVPTNIREVDLYMEAYPKNKHVSELYDELDLCFTVNKWKQIERDIVDDLIKQGVMGTWSFVDSRGYITIKPMRLDRTITNKCEKTDFSDMTRIGEFVPMSIGEIRVMAKEEIAKGEITEQHLADIASRASGRSYPVVGRDTIYNSARTSGYGYEAPYDHEKVNVLRWQAKSTDIVAYVINNDNGKITLEPRDNPFWLDKKGITDDQYASFNKEQGMDKRVLRMELENIYQAWWVVDSPVIFNYGLKSDIQRNLNSLKTAEFDAKLYTTDFDSVIRQLETVDNNAQINWLQFQHHSAMSIPDGIAINKRSLTEITVGGKGGTTLDAIDLLDMYIQTGRYIYKDKDGNNQEIKQPFEVIKGTDPGRALHHLQMVFQNIDLIRAILGLNEVTDASTPNPELGKAVSEMATMNSNTALGDFHYAYNYIYEETARSVARLVPMARKKKNPGYIEALGQESQNYWEQNSTNDFMDYSIKIDVGWDEEKHNSLRQAAQSSLKSAGGTLKPQDVYIIENEKNPEKAYMILEAKDRQRQKEALQESMALQEQNAQVQQQSALVAEQAKQQTLQMEAQFKMQEHQMELERMSHEAELKAFLIRLEKGMELQDNEKERFSQLVMSAQKNRTTLAVAGISAKSKSQAKKSA